jgi:hypothetical protein
LPLKKIRSPGKGTKEQGRAISSCLNVVRMSSHQVAPVKTLFPSLH